jgi:hypothetical protein
MEGIIRTVTARMSFRAALNARSLSRIHQDYTHTVVSMFYIDNNKDYMKALASTPSLRSSGQIPIKQTLGRRVHRSATLTHYVMINVNG